MSAESIAAAALKEAARLGLLQGVADTLAALVAGKPDKAKRLAENNALTAEAKLLAEARIRAIKRK